ncbi:SixA phosphatase family protein [Corynebacterium halotolerans]|uniref:SixA phosphatase family protein n=1 Tax=Corynebacterium halotolerans TaxID=225326 RepID=UPI003CF81E22
MSFPVAEHTLVILRHAKSSWKAPEPDHARPLNKRGRRDGVAAGEWLAGHVGPIDHVLCSTATRTRLTWERAQLGGAASRGVSYHDEIYEAPVGALVELIRKLDENVGTALLLGHWPGVEELVNLLAARDGHPGWAQMDEKFPTSAIAVLTVPGGWAALRDGTARLGAFVVPRG